MIKMYANAKINLYLQVCGRRTDGYHELDMIMQSIDLADTLYFYPSDALELEGGDTIAPLGENTILRAAQAFFGYTGIRGGVRVKVEKRIPIMAGLGGGSADAAATLQALNLLYGKPAGPLELAAIGKSVGADVPFALSGGCRRVRGIGEQMEEIENNLDCAYLLAKPAPGVSTKEAFALYDQTAAPAGETDIEKCVCALANGDMHSFAMFTANALEKPARQLCPQMATLLNAMKRSAGAAFMTGSGSCCVGLYKNAARARAARRELRGMADFTAIARAAKVGVALGGRMDMGL